MSEMSPSEQQAEWVGTDAANCFPASVDRETARLRIREICQRHGDALMKQWERKHKAQEERAV